MNVHHAGKMGDLIYALPAIRALARHEGPIKLYTSGLCHQLVPLLWEQPYILDVELDDTRPYQLKDGIMQNWEYFKDGEGINLSHQPDYYLPNAPLHWTSCYTQKAEVSLIEADYIVFPSLINHRNWIRGITVCLDSKPQELTKTIVIAPESETLEALEGKQTFWDDIIRDCLRRNYNVIVVGKNNDLPWMPKIYNDLRGLTTVPVMARIIAEAYGFIGAHSLPWHLARHSNVPAVCVQHLREGLRRCIPIDTPYTWIEPSEHMHALDEIEEYQ